MATCSDIITYALRMTKVLESGGTPTADESADGMIALQSFYDGMVTGGMFGRLEDTYMTESDTAEEGKRYYVPSGMTLTAATSEYVDPLTGDTRQPRDLAIYESLTAAGTRSVKVYDRTAWREMAGLTTATDPAPLSGRGAWGLAAAFASSGAFSAMFGVVADPEIVQLARQFMGSLSGKMGSTQDRDGADYY